MERGYIYLWRCIRDNHFWADKPFDRARAWIDLLMMANHKDGTIRQRGITVPIKRGQVGTSEVSLADKWGWSRGKVRRFLKDLSTTRQIEQQNNNVSSLITIVNYSMYQFNGTASDTANDTADGQQTDSKRTANSTGRINGNNGNKKHKGFTPPTLEEVQAYCAERKNSVDPRNFFDHYETRGWIPKGYKTQMKCWKSAVRTWENNRNKQQETTQPPPQLSLIPDAHRKAFERLHND